MLLITGVLSTNPKDFYLFFLVVVVVVSAAAAGVCGARPPPPNFCRTQMFTTVQ